MSRKNKKRVDAEAKIQALKEHVMEKKAISDICQNLDIQPSVFYSWQRELFTRGATLFEKKLGRRPVDRSPARISELEAKLAKKDSVIAELLQEHVELKKSLGQN